MNAKDGRFVIVNNSIPFKHVNIKLACRQEHEGSIKINNHCVNSPVKYVTAVNMLNDETDPVEPDEVPPNKKVKKAKRIKGGDESPMITVENPPELVEGVEQ